MRKQLVHIIYLLKYEVSRKKSRSWFTKLFNMSYPKMSNEWRRSTSSLLFIKMWDIYKTAYYREIKLKSQAIKF